MVKGWKSLRPQTITLSCKLVQLVADGVVLMCVQAWGIESKFQAAPDFLVKEAMSSHLLLVIRARAVMS